MLLLYIFTIRLWRPLDLCLRASHIGSSNTMGNVPIKEKYLWYGRRILYICVEAAQKYMLEIVQFYKEE